MKGLEIESTPVTVETAPASDAQIVPFDMQKTQTQIVSQFTEEELAEITDQIDIKDTESLVTFGKSAAEGISKCSDEVLQMTEMEQIQRTGEMLMRLNNIMQSFDATDFEEDSEKKPKKRGLLSRIVMTAKEQLEALLQKYDTMGKQIDAICNQLKQYETEIYNSNERLSDMFDANIAYYKQLEKYIAACPVAYRMLDEYRAELVERQAMVDDHALTFQIQNVDMAKQMLQQREVDLRTAESVAMQSLPMLKMMEYSNLNLNRKINTAFIITLPIFKQSIAQAILLKRQRVQAEALAALDKTTNELLIKNAQNTANQAKMVTQLANTNSINVDTLEQTYSTIMQGLKDCNTIMNDAARRRQSDTQRLIKLKEKILEQKI